MTVTVSAQSYSNDYPSYVPVSGGAWMEVITEQGTMTVVLPNTYQYETFGFSGDGYNVANITTSTVNGNVYHSTRFGYYGNPTELQCHFTRMGTLEVYEPYRNNNNGTSYRWTSLPITEIKATNVALMDSSGTRYNDDYLYSPMEKVGILTFVAALCISFIFIGWRCWHA